MPSSCLGGFCFDVISEDPLVDLGCDFGDHRDRPGRGETALAFFAVLRGAGFS